MLSKKLSTQIMLLLLTPIFLFGCDNTFNTDETETKANQEEGNSETVEVSQEENNSNQCPEDPVKLESENVEEITFNGNQTTVSGQLRGGESLGYVFDGEEEQTLSYSTDDEFCMWVLTPDNDPLEDLELPTDGSYIVQISIPRGAKTFELTMNLNDPESSYASNNGDQSNNISFDEIETNNNTNSSSNNSPSITPQEAVNLIQEWQQAKREIFAPPYNRDLGEQLLTGKAYADNIRKPDGSGSSVDWLENNGAYYTYNLQQIDEVTDFNDSGGSSFIEIVTREQRTLCIDGRPSRDDNTASDKRLVRYNLQYVQGEWKISSYETQNVINKSSNPNKYCEF